MEKIKLVRVHQHHTSGPTLGEIHGLEVHHWPVVQQGVKRKEEKDKKKKEEKAKKAKEDEEAAKEDDEPWEDDEENEEEWEDGEREPGDAEEWYDFPTPDAWD